MGLEDKKIKESELGAFAKRTVLKGNFSNFSKSFEQDSKQGLDKLAENIKASRDAKINENDSMTI